MTQRLEKYMTSHENYLQLIYQINNQLYQLIRHFNLSHNKDFLELIGCTKQNAKEILKHSLLDWQRDLKRGWPFFEILLINPIVKNALNRPFALKDVLLMVLSNASSINHAKSCFDDLFVSQRLHIKQVNCLILELIDLLSQNPQANTYMHFKASNETIRYIASNHFAISQLITQGIPLFKLNWPKKDTNGNDIFSCYHATLSNCIPTEPAHTHPISSLSSYKKNIFLAQELAKLNVRPVFIAQMTNLRPIHARKIYANILKNSMAPTGKTPTTYSWFAIRPERQKHGAFLLLLYAHYQHFFAGQEKCLSILMAYLDYKKLFDGDIVSLPRFSILVSGFPNVKSIFQKKATNTQADNIKLIACKKCNKWFVVNDLQVNYSCRSCRLRKKELT